MNLIRLFALVFTLIAMSILYIASSVISEPPLWTSLTGRETVTVVSTGIEERAGKFPARPEIAVRDREGEDSTLGGYAWTSRADAAEMRDRWQEGGTGTARRWNGRLWRPLGGTRDWIAVAISLLALLGMALGLRMIWIFRPR